MINDNFLRKKKQYYVKCKNCGRGGHMTKSCREPVTSWGVILVKIDGMKNIPIIHKDDTVIEIGKLDELLVVGKNGINQHEMKKIYHLLRQIKLLMVSRKHSLGYVEFVRGRYNLASIDNISFTISQMLPEEIKKIKEHIGDFKFLWEDLWGKENCVSGKYQRDYVRALTNYNRLKEGVESFKNLEWFLENIKPSDIYSKPEFGFPKGRKNVGESDIDCATREFMEETGLEKRDFKIIDSIEPIVEIHIGTDGVKYRHIYYLAESVTGNGPVMNGGKNQKYEVGSAGFYTYYDSEFCIRSYHYEKKKIFTGIVFYYLSKLLQNTHIQVGGDIDKINDVDSRTDDKIND